MIKDMYNPRRIEPASTIFQIQTQIPLIGSHGSVSSDGKNIYF